MKVGLVKSVVVMIALVVLASTFLLAKNTTTGRSSVGAQQDVVVISVSTVVPSGAPIVAQAISQGPNLTLVATDIVPRLSVQDAQNAVNDTGVPWKIGAMATDKAITVSAYFGLATMGMTGNTSRIFSSNGSSPKGGCENWLGPCDIPVVQCTSGKECSATGAIIPRVEARPIWLIDYGNVVFHGSRVTYNHSVYAVDDETRTVLFAWGYNGP